MRTHETILAELDAAEAKRFRETVKHPVYRLNSKDIPTKYVLELVLFLRNHPQGLYHNDIISDFNIVTVATYWRMPDELKSFFTPEYIDVSKEKIVLNKNEFKFMHLILAPFVFIDRLGGWIWRKIALRTD